MNSSARHTTLEFFRSGPRQAQHLLEREARGLLQSNGSTFTTLQRIADAALIAGSLYVAHELYPSDWNTAFTVAALLGVLGFYLVAEVNGLYRSWRAAPVREEIFHVLVTWAAVVPMLLFLGFATKTSAQYSRVVSVMWFLAAPSALVLWRLCVRVALTELRRRGRNTRTVAIAGATRMARQLARRIGEDASYGMKIHGFYDDRACDRRHDPDPEVGSVVGNLELLVEDARLGKLDIIYIALPLKAEPRINAIVRRLADTTATVYVAADFFVFDMLHARWTNVGDIPVVSIFDSPFHGIGGWLKRLEDLVIGTLILSIIAIPMLLIAIAVKLTSPGPVFFVQKRYGLNGRQIGTIKFRTMNVCQDGDDVPQARKNDPRVTRFGAFLRRNSLDELPQFFNVLKGEMSIVGPRPHAVAHNELYRSKVHGYMLRHKVKPGITGWAQVNGWRGETDTVEKMEKRIEHDLHYIHNWNLSWDLKIIFLTVFGSKKAHNAY
jgi:putative colanic acid biosysnthesis UDP-glucose lipid carrier transferase